MDYGADHDVAMNDVVVAQIFKIKNGHLSLWASFNGHREKKYTSAEAKKFAGAKGFDNTEVADGSDPTKSEGQTPEINPSDILKKGLGAILKGGFKF